jgi:hypothetical protein
VSPAENDDIHSDDESAGAFESAPPSSIRKRNNKRLVCLSNGVVSMRDLDLASRVPTKTRDDDAAKMFHAKLTFEEGILPVHNELKICEIVLSEVYLQDRELAKTLKRRLEQSRLLLSRSYLRHLLKIA